MQGARKASDSRTKWKNMTSEVKRRFYEIEMSISCFGWTWIMRWLPLLHFVTVKSSNFHAKLSRYQEKLSLKVGIRVHTKGYRYSPCFKRLQISCYLCVVSCGITPMHNVFSLAAVTRDRIDSVWDFEERLPSIPFWMSIIKRSKHDSFCVHEVN